MRPDLVLMVALPILLSLEHSPALADSPLEYEASGLIGTVIVSGDANENVGDLQLGASGEVSWDNFVLGLRGTRTRTRTRTPRGYDPCAFLRQYEFGPCFPTNVRTIGLDAGYEWDLKPIHFSPRLGVGYADDTDGTYRAGYLEPGFVLSAQYGGSCSAWTSATARASASTGTV